MQKIIYFANDSDPFYFGIVVSMFYPITGNNDTLTAADGVVVTGAEVGTENDICSKNIKDKMNSV